MKKTKKNISMIKTLLLTIISMSSILIGGCTIIYEDSSPLTRNEDGTYTQKLSNIACNNLEVYYLDLKNNNNETKIGDSTYIKCNDIDIVIDAGTKGVGSATVVPFLKEKVTDKTIELVIATHTDADHIGGFIGLSNQEGVLSIEGFTYNYILESGYSASSQTYTDVMELMTSSGAKICTGYEAITGTNECAKIFKMGNITLEVLDTGFYNDNKAEANDRSIVTLLTHGETTYLFPGDLEDDEQFADTIGHVDIFKASHHGASSANSTKLLEALTPEIIILSTDGDNTYDIPQQESLDRMYAVTNKIYATFVTGTIKITSDGSSYNIESDNLILFQDSEWFTQNRILN